MKTFPFLLPTGLLVVTAAIHGAESPQQTHFEPPFRLEAQGSPIDVEVGHAAPLVIDFDGDQLDDLLVGQFGGGKLRIYRNIGSKDSPQFGPFAWFKANRKIGTIPAS